MTFSCEDGWTPQSQPGGVYCSRLCGGRCKRVDFDRATRDAAALAERLGSGWRPRVWENLGWHWKVAKGHGFHHHGLAEILPLIDRDDRDQVNAYMVMLNFQTEGIDQVIVDAADPIEALGLAMQEARTRALRFEAELNAVSADEA